MSCGPLTREKDVEGEVHARLTEIAKAAEAVEKPSARRTTRAVTQADNRLIPP